MTIRWYVAQGKQKTGPFSFNELRQLVAAGTLHETDMVLAEGEPKWVAASSLPGLFPTHAEVAAVKISQPGQADSMAIEQVATGKEESNTSASKCAWANAVTGCKTSFKCAAFGSLIGWFAGWIFHLGFWKSYDALKDIPVFETFFVVFGLALLAGLFGGVFGFAAGVVQRITNSNPSSSRATTRTISVVLGCLACALIWRYADASATVHSQILASLGKWREGQMDNALVELDHFPYWDARVSLVRGAAYLGLGNPVDQALRSVESSEVSGEPPLGQKAVHAWDELIRQTWTGRIGKPLDKAAAWDSFSRVERTAPKPVSAAAACGLGACCLASEEFVKGVELLDRAIQTLTEDSFFYARREEEIIWSLGLHRSDAHLFRGLCHYGNGEYQKATADFDKTIELRPKDPNAYRQRAKSQAKLGNYGLAITDLTEAIKLAPKLPVYYEERASAYNAIQEFMWASNDLAKAKELRNNR